MSPVRFYSVVVQFFVFRLRRMSYSMSLWLSSLLSSSSIVVHVFRWPSHMSVVSIIVRLRRLSYSVVAVTVFVVSVVFVVTVLVVLNS